MADDQAQHRGRADDGQQLDDEVQMGVGHEERHGVRPDRHEGAVAERDLPVDAGEQAQARQGDDVQGDLARPRSRCTGSTGW